MALAALTEPTPAMRAGIRDAIKYLRRKGAAGTEVLGHRDGYATSCPGEALYRWVRAGAPRPASAPTTPAAPSTPPATAPALKEEPVPEMLNEHNAIDVELQPGVWTGLAMHDAVLHSGPRRHCTVVHVLLDPETPPDAVVEGRFYLTDTAGKNPSAYLPTRGYGGGGHQFVCTADVPADRHLRFEVRVTPPDGRPVTLLHRHATGPYWAL